VHDSSLPPNAVIEFYFHGYDEWGGNIWDNNGGLNYTREFAGAEKFRWRNPEQIPAYNVEKLDLAVYRGVLYAVWSANGGIQFSSRQDGAAWASPSLIVSFGNYPCITASDFGIQVIYCEGYYGNIYYIKSTDYGKNWSSPIVCAPSYCGSRYAIMTTDGDYVYVAYNEFFAPEDSNIYFVRKHKDASSFEERRYVLYYHSYKATVEMKDFEVQGSIVAISMKLVGWYGGYGTPVYGVSRDGGYTWTTGTDFAGDSRMDICNGVIYAGKVYEGAQGMGFYVAKNENGTFGDPFLCWSNFGDTMGLFYLPKGLVLIKSTDGQFSSIWSQNDGRTWTEPEPACLLPDVYLMRDLEEGNRIYMLVFSYGQSSYYTVSTAALPLNLTRFQVPVR
jgi:hypothetical protein